MYLYAHIQKREFHIYLFCYLIYIFLRYMPNKAAVNYHTVEEYIQDLHSPLYSGTSLLEPNIIKTHENALQFKDRINALGSGLLIPRVIILSRDPKKCVPSYYNYVKVMGILKSDSFENFFSYLKRMGREWFFWISSWSEYQTLYPKSCLEIKYEDLIDNPSVTLLKISKFIGWDVTDSLILKALELSSRKNMKNYEDKYGDGMVYVKNFSFASERKTDNDKDSAFKKSMHILIQIMHESSMSIKLSILIPAYNRPEHLEELLLSLTSQVNKEIEIIISDDCSPKSNEIKMVINKYKKLVPNLIFYYQELNLGEVGNKNFLYKKAIGKYLLYIGDDDLFEAGAIRNFLELIDKFQENDIFILGHIQEDDSGRYSKKRKFIYPCAFPGESLINFGAMNYDWFPLPFWSSSKLYIPQF